VLFGLYIDGLRERAARGIVQRVKPNDVTGARKNTSGDAVDVWLLDLPAAGATAWTILAPDEIARAERFRFERDRARWVAARSGLRTILGSYNGRHPSSLRFRYGTHGKPALIREPGDPDLRFNLSHSRSLAVVAVATGRDVGVDVEAIGDGRDVEALAARFLTPHERAAFAALPHELRVRGFYGAWSRKEAFIKARGDALWLALQSFDVSLAPGEPARLLSTRPDPHEAARWTLCDIDVGPQFVAALAIQGAGCTVSQHWLGADGR